MYPVNGKVGSFFLLRNPRVNLYSIGKIHMLIHILDTVNHKVFDWMHCVCYVVSLCSMV